MKEGEEITPEILRCNISCGMGIVVSPSPINYKATMVNSNSFKSTTAAATLLEFNSDDEFEFPPLPTSLPPLTPVAIEHVVDEPPPPLSQSDPSLPGIPESVDEIKTPDEDDSEFPLPPPPECLSPIRSTSDQDESKGNSYCNDMESNFATPPPLPNGLNEISKPSRSGFPSYSSYIYSNTKVPFFKSGSSLTTSISSNINSSTKDTLSKTVVKSLDDQLTHSKSNENGYQEEFMLIKQEESTEISEVIKDSGILSDIETMESPTNADVPSECNEDVFTDENDLDLSFNIVPPPAFGGMADNSVQSEPKLKSFDAMSVARGKLASNETINSIVKHYFSETNSTMLENPSQEAPPKTEPKRPMIANALLTKHDRCGGSQSSINSTPKSLGRKESFDSTLNELKDFIRLEDDFRTILGSSKRWLGYGSCQTQKCFDLDPQDIGNSSTGLVRESKPAQKFAKQSQNDEGFNNLVDKAAKLVDISAMPAKKKPPTQSRVFKLCKTPTVLGYTEEQIKATIQAQKLDQGPESDCSNSLNRTTNKVADEGVTNEKEQVISTVQNRIFGPNVLGFTEDQIASMLQNKDATTSQNFSQDISDINRDLLQESNTSATNGEDISVEVLERVGLKKIQETRKIFERNSSEQHAKNVNLQRSKSAASSSKKKPSVENKGSLETGAAKLDENGNEEKSKILPVSKTKAFFESIKKENTYAKLPRKQPERSLTFSVNKTASNFKFEDSHLKYKNGRKPNVEAPAVPKNNHDSETNLESHESVSPNTNDQLVDGTPHLPVENLVFKFGTAKRNMTKKSSIDSYVPLENSAKLPGKSLTSLS